MIQTSKDNRREIVDEEIQDITSREEARQKSTLCMIPSENFTSHAVMDAQGNMMTNKYSEGYPGKRYYQGNGCVDEVENLAIQRAKKLFGAEHANVQCLSGSPANMAVYFAMLEPGDKAMGMNLNHGGHLTHGSPVNFSGKLYKWVEYGVEENGHLNMKKVREIALKEKPKLILSGFTAYPRRVDFKAFHEIAQEVGAYSMADISHIAGLIAGGAHESPFPFTDFVTTTTHKTLRGPRSAIIMCKEKYAKQIDKAVFPGLQGGPHMHTIAAKAVAFEEAMQPSFKGYAQCVVENAKCLADELMSLGVKLVSDGTDTHLLLIDLIRSGFEKGMGKKVAQALEDAGIVCNANTIPFEPSSPFRPSGVRMGTAALTTQGMGKDEMKMIAGWIRKVLDNVDDEEKKHAIRNNVQELCCRFELE